ncbi:hypothetical protein [Pseudonocardia nigra]|uniref:hypothetical protein n=1 Tax=Pseudonocardia nigra TaxID=1921578 RepID=UPI001C60187E|nr:hypothetical protein [Pseudonocardia nigra]
MTDEGAGPPGVLVAGDGAPAASRAFHCKDLHDALTGLGLHEVVLVGSSGHAANSDQVEAFNSALLDFLGEL